MYSQGKSIKFILPVNRSIIGLSATAGNFYRLAEQAPLELQSGIDAAPLLIDPSGRNISSSFKKYLPFWKEVLLR